MGLNIVDKRKINRDQSVENRQRFLKRVRSTIKEQLPRILNGRKLKDIDATGGSVKVSGKTITEPTFHHGPGGNIDRVMPGNPGFVEGDLIAKPKKGNGGRGKQGSTNGPSEDDFIVELSRAEFLDVFFDDLELPDMIKMQLTKIKETRNENAGFQPEGPPNKLSVIRSYKQSMARRLPLRKKYEREIEEIERELAVPADAVSEHRIALSKRLELLVKRRDSIPLFEEIDLRYRATVKREIPVAHATMIMIMDNSGSMGLKEKTIARKFFWLLYSFLQREYEQVDMIFVSHTEIAREMEEEEFFNTHVSGGTIVSSALELTSSIIKERLLGKTNIYVAQISDGDNYDTDNGTCTELLEDDILPFVRYFAYVQVDDYHGSDGSVLDGTVPSHFNFEKGLWRSYKSLADRDQKLQVRRVVEERDIFPIFHELFSKKRGHD